MNSGDPEAAKQFLSVWKDAVGKILSQLGAASPVIDDGDVATIRQAGPGEADLISAIFAGGGCLNGALQWSCTKRAAVTFAQLLMSEPIDPGAEFTDTHADGFMEFLRQVAGEAALAWKEAKGAPAELVYQTEAKANVQSDTSAVVRVTGETIQEMLLRVDLDVEMARSLATTQNTAEQSVSERREEAEIAEEHPLPSNLDLLLDVQLDATIRFGEREMLLQDVFGLMPGAVVELDQLVNEPAELLVAGRLVAKGEVVVVEGNFGLRVTEVASPAQRAVALSLT